MERSGFISYLKGTDAVATYYTTVSNNEVMAIKDAAGSDAIANSMLNTTTQARLM